MSISKPFRNLRPKKAEIEGLDTGKLTELEHKEAELLSRISLFEEDIQDSEKKLAAFKGRTGAEKRKPSCQYQFDRQPVSK